MAPQFQKKPTDRPPLTPEQIRQRNAQTNDFLARCEENERRQKGPKRYRPYAEPFREPNYALKGAASLLVAQPGYEMRWQQWEGVSLQMCTNCHEPTRGKALFHDSDERDPGRPLCFPCALEWLQDKHSARNLPPKRYEGFGYGK